MDTLTSLMKQTDLSTTGKEKGRPEQIGSLLGDSGYETLTSSNEKLKKMAEKETVFQPPSTVTDRFYSALKAIYGTKFSSQFSTPAEVHQSKAMWAREIDGLSEDQLRKCLQNAKREMLSGNKDYLWPNMGLILGYCSNDWERQAHRIVDQSNMLENKTAKEKRIEQGRNELQKMREELGL